MIAKEKLKETCSGAQLRHHPKKDENNLKVLS